MTAMQSSPASSSQAPSPLALANGHAPGGWPLAGLAALLIIALVESNIDGGSESWAGVAAMGGRLGLIERGVVADRLELWRLSPRPQRPVAVYVMGTSRAQQAIREVDDLGVPADYAMLTHPGMQPYEMLSSASEVAAEAPDIAILVISEFDTHRPLSLGPQTAPGSLAALVELIRAVGPAFAWRQRTVMLQLLLSTLLDSYRFRSVLSGLGPGRWRYFGVDPPADDVERGLTPLVSHTLVDIDRALSEMHRLFPFVPDRTLLQELRLVQGVTVGPHVPIQMALLRRTCEVLTDVGCQVIVVEAPLHPLAARFHDATVRRDFLAFASTLHLDLGVQLLTLEQSGPFDGEDFADLTHLNISGSEQLVGALHGTLSRLAAAAWARKTSASSAR